MDYYPTNVMETGADLVFKWVPRMIMFGLYLTGEVPFKDIYFHGMVLDKKGVKMSKSKGNVMSPIELAQDFGTERQGAGLQKICEQTLEYCSVYIHQSRRLRPYGRHLNLR